MDLLISTGDPKIMTLPIISKLTPKERKLTLSLSENSYISILNSIVRESKTKSARTVCLKPENYSKNSLNTQIVLTRVKSTLKCYLKLPKTYKVLTQ